LDDSIDLAQIEHLDQEGLDKRLVTPASLKRGLLNADDSLSANAIFAEDMPSFKFSTLDIFKGSDDSQDLETFIFGFRKKNVGVGGL
jgi:hypothetical protein